MTTGRIDLHQHLVPGEYSEAFATAGGGHALPGWSPAIATGVLSLDIGHTLR
ncbi:hypothetical protein [Streptomyces sp. NPDC101149]|uniref:hypothetical protein n=1 Tax=Streptomyces sp. NPDC101149 TaxID=3366113 RepID=UPI003828F8C4